MNVRFVVIFLPLLLVACAQKSIIEYSQQDRVALVIVGLSGNTSWSELTSTDYHIHTYKYPDNKPEDVVLMPVSVGTRFQILEISQQTEKRDISYEFKRSPMLNIYQDKIYYYGVIQSYVDENNRLRTRIVTDADQAVIDRAKLKYPDIFQRKPDIQFRNDDLTEDLLHRKEVNWENTAYSKYLKSKKQSE